MRAFAATLLAIGLVVLGLPPRPGGAQDRKLGWLSESEEVGRGGPATISPGKFKRKDPATGVFAKDKDGNDVYTPDRGGPSYGSYQFASKVGIDGSTVKAFVARYYPEDFADLDARARGETRLLDPLADKPRFDQKWAEVVRAEGDLFRNNEHEFIYETHYVPVARAVREQTGLDVEARGDALRNVLWSVAVQHGPPSDPRATGVQVFVAALKEWTREQLGARPGVRGGVSDEDIINAVYDERGRTRDDGKMAYFPKHDLSPRFRRERANALVARARERVAAEAPDLNQTELGKLAKGVGIIAGPVRKKSPDLSVGRGQATFDLSGYDRDFNTTRTPSVPNRRSGVRLGRGYDLARVDRQQAEADLRAAGLSAGQVESLAGAAGLVGDAARRYLDGQNASRLSKEAQDKGLTGAERTRYVNDRVPKTITLAQQRKLFEVQYARAEADARERLFADLDRFPPAAREAVLDLVFDRGADELAKSFPKFVEAVRKKDWAAAAEAAKRNGAGVARNQMVRQKLLGAAQAKAGPR